MPSYESSMRNLAKAKSRWCPPRPWRSVEESRIIRRLVYLWFTGRDRRTSARAWAKALGISHTWMQKLIRQFREDPTQMIQEVRCYGLATFEHLNRARKFTRRMEENGELRGSRLAKIADFFKHYPH
jgi:hypothetical protein